VPVFIFDITKGVLGEWMSLDWGNQGCEGSLYCGRHACTKIFNFQLNQEPEFTVHIGPRLLGVKLICLPFKHGLVTTTIRKRNISSF